MDSLGDGDDDMSDIEANYTENSVMKNRGLVSKGKGKAASNDGNPKVMLLSLKAVRTAQSIYLPLMEVTLGCRRAQFNG